MCDNYLLLFLGLRTCINKSTSNSGAINMPWKKTTQYIKSFFYRNQISNIDNYINKSDVIKCVNNNKNSKSIVPLKHTSSESVLHSRLNNSPMINGSNSPVIINTADSPITSPSLHHRINQNYINTRRNQNTECNSLKICIISWMYTLFILCLLSLPVISYINKCINTNTYYIPYILFYMIYPSQYIFSVIYYSNDHYDRLIHRWNTKFIKRGTINLSKTDTVTISITIISFIISISTLIFTIRNQLDHKYDNKEYFYIILFLEWIYGRTLLLYNLFVFFFIFHTHLNDMKKNVDFLEKSNWVFYRDTKRISDICISIIIQKFELEESITNLQNIFSSATLLGTIGFCITWINYKEYGCDT